MVNRIEDLLYPPFLLDWRLLFDENNHGKMDHPYTMPNAFITSLANILDFTAFHSGHWKVFPEYSPGTL